ncbi:hypothetical protein PF005_g23292 [Phytophthora fragariae]|uniref:Uncharacterized protein n=1 Tax=Phytophthora fragariae TaxID=53985 RepID=A0A6A3W7I5_9STRA|nr:hypothetical protein PF006_g22163 [Phytophthora fragariae]KAE9180397.1 hypothetical protein PF005_g23292 [Phytophthora fragariae]
MSGQALRLARSPEQSNEPRVPRGRHQLRLGSVWLAPNVRGVEGNMCVIQARTGYGKGKTPEQSRDGACVDMEKMLLQEQVAISEKKCMYADADTAALVSE